MNKKRYRTMAAAVVALFVFLFQSPLQAARERRGSTVEVILIDRHQIEGELLAVKGRDLIIHDKSRDQGFTVNIEQVSEIKIKKRSLILPGLGIGLVAGAGVGFGLYTARAARDSDPCQLAPYAIMSLVLPCITAIIGSVVGAALSFSKEMPIKGQETAHIESSLSYLQKHARY